ncbi:MAG: glycosyltransferase [Porphyromonadaceae bacterium]|nr:glycosyltransferase [Porphyromonadaceae bacterium]
MNRLDLILPAYNPREGWEQYALERIDELRRLRPRWEIHLYIAPDASKVGHNQAVRQALSEGAQGQITYIDYARNRGKGYALRSAVAQTKASYMLYTDWDFPFSTESYLQVLDALEAGADVVLPTRERSEYMQKLSPMRKFLSGGSRLINRLLLNLPANDTQGGLKAFGALGRKAFLSTRIDRFLFDTEFIALATRRRLNIAITRCHVRPEIVLSSMSFATLRSELRYIPRLIRARWFS